MLIWPNALILKEKFFWNLLVVASLERFINIKTKDSFCSATIMKEVNKVKSLLPTKCRGSVSRFGMWKLEQIQIVEFT